MNLRELAGQDNPCCLTKAQMQERGYTELFKDSFYLLQAYGQPNDTDEYWEAVIAKANEIGERYKGSRLYPFSTKIIVEILNELERVYKEGKA